MSISLKKLKDQVIVITGASSKVGIATAKMAAAKGAKVLLTSKNEDALLQLATELRAKGYPATWVPADIGREEDVHKIADAAIRTFGRFDTWVNSSDVSLLGESTEATQDDIKRMFNMNYRGIIYSSKIAINHFKERGVPGALINMSAVWSDRGTVIPVPSSASNFSVKEWTDNLRAEIAKDKAPVSITLLHPGKAVTPYNETMKKHKVMVYPAGSVAENIIYAAQHPKEDIPVYVKESKHPILSSLAVAGLGVIVYASIKQKDQPYQSKDQV